MPHVTVREDATGTLRYTPTQGAPVTSATATLYNPDGSVLQAADAAVIPTVATTVNGTYPIGAQSIVLDDTTNIAADAEYWAGDAGTEQLQLVTVDSVESTINTVHLNEPLQRGVLDGSDWRGSEITYALTTAHTATRGENFRVEWAYTVDGTAYDAVSTFDVFKRIFRINVSEEQLRVHLPPAVRSVIARLGSTSAIIEEVQRDVVRQLRRYGYKADLVRDSSQFDYLAVVGLERIILRRRVLAGELEAVTALETVEAEWKNEWDQLVGTSPRWYDADDDLVFDTGDDGSGEDEGAVRRVKYGVLA